MDWIPAIRAQAGKCGLISMRESILIGYDNTGILDQRIPYGYLAPHDTRSTAWVCLDKRGWCGTLDNRFRYGVLLGGRFHHG